MFRVSFSGGEGRGVFSLSIGKRYRDKEGRWKTSSAFDPNDAPKLMLAIMKAYEFINQGQPENEGCAEQYEADRMINQMACFHT
jgi:hypothetical protein